MTFKNLMLKKSVAAVHADSQSGELKRTLTAANLISLGIGCIIGTGIFVMTGTAAAQYAGPAIILSFVLAGIACGFAGLCYAELSAMLPVSGSAYSYSYASLGEMAAWIMGWLLLLEYGIAGSTVAVGWSGYVASFLKDFGVFIPDALTKATFVMNDSRQIIMNPDVAGVAFNLPAFLGIAIVTVLLVLGVKESATINNIIVFIKLTVIILFIGVGVMYINPDNWHPFIPENTGTWGDFGISGILRGAGIVFFAYVGFEAVSTASQEAKNPQRDIPIGILGSLVVCTILYMLVSLVLTGVVKYDTLNVPEPIAVAADAMGIGWLKFLVKVGAIAGLSSVMLVLMYGQTRIFYTMARDGLLPPVFARVHPKFQTPWVNTLVVGAISSVVAGALPIDILGDLVNLGTMLAFAIICFTVYYLRKKEPNMARPFSVPKPAVTPLLGMLCCLSLAATLWHTVLMLIPYFLLGFAIYFFYGYKNSKLRNNAA